ncbi:hypothetical protein H5410_061758 [Solanum commersonii]|uniref:Uncharacterized protein n=1 Tax=Solanum commersonii TaxID=4109 RepID=A0A9J5WA58_SOLCO|nr:hypothetical protein H5410_061758 [Solanum commersonii]
MLSKNYPLLATWLPSVYVEHDNGTPRKCVLSDPLRTRERSSQCSTRITNCSRRYEPDSRTTLMGEQPNPWNMQVAKRRHRGAKPSWI